MKLRFRPLLALVPLMMGLNGAQAVTPNPKVLIETSMGNMVVQLNPQRAPETVKNFLRYTDEGFFDGTVFHRVIPGFMIQGGGFTSTMAKKETHEPIKNEAAGGFNNDKYTIAMARTSDPHSATSQFFINVADNDFLNQKKSPDGWGYCAFGRVIEGQSVADMISLVPTGFHPRTRMQDVPREPVVIKHVRRLP